MAQRQIEEDRLRISVPKDRYFRFEDCTTYQAVNAHGLKEADIAWMHEDDNTLWLLELKDYGSGIPAQIADAREKLEKALPKKVVHSVLMVASVWSGVPFGRRLRRNIEDTFPAFPVEAVPIRAVVVINTSGPGDLPLLGPLQDAVRRAVSALELDAVLVLPVGHSAIQERLGINVSVSAA